MAPNLVVDVGSFARLRGTFLGVCLVPFGVFLVASCAAPLMAKLAADAVKSGCVREATLAPLFGNQPGLNWQ